MNEVSQSVFRRTFGKGDVIFSEGDPGDVAYLVETGEVKIVKVVDGKKLTLARIAENGVFGEMALIDAKPRMAGAVATKDGTSCFVIPAARFHGKMEGLDPFMRGILRVLTTNLRVLSNRYFTDVDVKAIYDQGGGI